MIYTVWSWLMQMEPVSSNCSPRDSCNILNTIIFWFFFFHFSLLHYYIWFQGMYSSVLSCCKFSDNSVAFYTCPKLFVNCFCVLETFTRKEMNGSSRVAFLFNVWKAKIKMVWKLTWFQIWFFYNFLTPRMWDLERIRFQFVEILSLPNLPL